MNKLSKILLVIGIILVVLLITFFVIPIPHTTTINRVGYEPYQIEERYCADRSWWSGKCIDYEYRTVTKERYIDEERQERRTSTIYEMLTKDVWYITEKI